jgi:hypothetical protein
MYKLLDFSSSNPMIPCHHAIIDLHEHVCLYVINSNFYEMTQLHSYILTLD